MPTFDDVLPIKAQSNIDRALAFTSDMDLDQYRGFITKACYQTGLSPLDVAAAFLREGLGEEREKLEISSENPSRSRRKKDGRRRDDRRREERRKSADHRKSDEGHKPADRSEHTRHSDRTGHTKRNSGDFSRKRRSSSAPGKNKVRRKKK